MSPRHFRTLFDLEPSELGAVLNRAHELKALRGKAHHPKPLAGKSVAIILEKASTRTRLSFEVGVHELGGQPITLIAKDTQLGRGEPIEDTAKMLSGYVHCAVYRTFGHDRIEALAANSSIPIINGLSDTYHPCQLLADLQAVEAEFGKNKGDLRGLKVAWIGDGNNMAHSWINAAALTGFELAVASPKEFAVAKDVVDFAQSKGAKLTFTESPKEATKGAHVVTTDVWASMGQEDEAQKRAAAFKGFIVDEALMEHADSKAIFLHCLPAHRGEEVSAGVLEGKQSRVWAEAENRLHAQKALLEFLIRN